MEYKKIINLLYKIPINHLNLTQKNWVEINSDSGGTYNIHGFETWMLKSSLCDYSDAYILFKGTITIIRTGVGAIARQAGEGNEEVTFENCAAFTDFISEVNNIQSDNAN